MHIINILCEQNAYYLNVKAGSTYTASNRCALVCSSYDILNREKLWKVMSDLCKEKFI
jgi:hypothetical protein